MTTNDIQVNPNETLPHMADDLYDKALDKLIKCAREAGIRIVDASTRINVSRDVRLATAVAQDFAEANAATSQADPVLGVFYLEGRVCGQLKGPGFYTVRVVLDGSDRIAVISDGKGNDVTRVPIKTSCEPELFAVMNGCCSGSEIGEGFACVGFSCCNPLSGCITNDFCFAI